LAEATRIHSAPTLMRAAASRSRQDQRHSLSSDPFNASPLNHHSFSVS